MSESQEPRRQPDFSILSDRVDDVAGAALHAPGGRAHRLVVVAQPLPQQPEPKEPS